MNLRPILSDLFPENSYGGECGLMVRLNLASIEPIGNQYSDKKKSVDKYGIKASQLQGDFRIGDVVVTNEGTNWLGQGYGHVAFINNIVGNLLYFTEWNFKGDGRVHHGRTMEKNSSKIYGIIRRPFKFKLPPVELNIRLLMNHQKSWQLNKLDELKDWFWLASKGQMKINIYPLYTYNALKNWWYSFEGTDFGEYFKVIDRGYIKEQVLPFGSSGDNKKADFILWCITKAQWHGAVFNKPNTLEVGWKYPNLPVAVISCDENDKSIIYPQRSAFIHYATHEICHFLEAMGNRRGLSQTDIFDLQELNLSKVFNNIEWDYLKANL